MIWLQLSANTGPEERCLCVKKALAVLYAEAVRIGVEARLVEQIVRQPVLPALAVKEALAAGVPHPNVVRLALKRRRTARGSPPPLALVLPEHVRRKDTPLRPHRLDSPKRISFYTTPSPPEKVFYIQ